MLIRMEFVSKNDGREKFIEFKNIEDYLQHSKSFTGVSARVSLSKECIKIRLTESIYHTGEFENK